MDRSEPKPATARHTLLPELGKMSRKQIAAFVGLAPYDCSPRADEVIE